MKKFLIALAVVGLSANMAFGRRCCPTEQPMMAQPAVYQESAAFEQEPVIPTCTTTRQVPYTAYRTEVVHVAPIREEIPQAPVMRAVAQPDLVVRHKQAPIIRPDLICRTKQPCKYVCEPQPNKVRYYCPVGTETSACAAPCA